MKKRSKRRRALAAVEQLSSMHPGFPVLFRRSLERAERRRARFAFAQSLVARDGAVVFGLAIVIGLLVFLAGGR